MCVKRAVPGQGRIYVVALIHKHKRMPNKAWETEALSAKIITLIVTALLLGRVDGFDQDECAGECDERGEVSRGLLAA
jgi:hypothetical protein